MRGSMGPTLAVIDPRDVSAYAGPSYRVAIRDQRNRLVTEVIVANEWDDETSLELWRDGLLACDATRHEILTHEKDGCPHTRRVRYAVLWVELQDGRVIAIDEPLVLH